MSVTFYVDWPQLEPVPGQYEVDGLAATLAWLSGLGIQPLLNITLIDITDRSLADDMTLHDLQLQNRWIYSGCRDFYYMPGTQKGVPTGHDGL